MKGYTEKNKILVGVLCGSIFVYYNSPHCSKFSCVVGLSAESGPTIIGSEAFVLQSTTHVDRGVSFLECSLRRNDFWEISLTT